MFKYTLLHTLVKGLKVGPKVYTLTDQIAMKQPINQRNSGISVSLALYLCLWLCLCLCLSLSLPLSLSVFVSHTVPVSLSNKLSFSVCLYLSLFRSLSLLIEQPREIVLGVGFVGNLAVCICVLY